MVSAIATSTEKDNQLLLNVFNKWSNRADLIICVDKCSTFGIRKNGNSSTQFKVIYLKVNNEVIPPVKVNEIFMYVGKTVSYTMSVGKVKRELISDFNPYIDTINRLPLHHKNKLDIMNLDSIVKSISSAGFIYPKMLTWVIYACCQLSTRTIVQQP